MDSIPEIDARMDIRAMLSAVWRRMPRIIAVTVVLMAAVWGVLHFVPKMYDSSAGLLVAPRDNAFTRPTGATTPQSTTVDQATMSSQIQLIQSRDTLMPVIEQLNLRAVPEFNGTEKGALSFLSKPPAPEDVDEYVLRQLDKRLSVFQQRDSNIITIEASSEDPKLAAAIANAVAAAHVRRQAELSVSDTVQASEWLKGQIDKMRQQVAEAESKVANFRIDNDLFTGSNNTPLSDQQLTDIQNQITAAQGRKNDARSRSDLIRRLLANGQPIDSVSDVRESVVVQQLSEQKANLTAQKAQLLATLLPNHPSVRAIDAQIDEIDKQIQAEGQHIADSLDAEAKVEADIEASLRSDLAKAKTASASATKNGVTLDQLQREAKAQRDLLDTYLARYREATSRAGASAALPDVRVVTMAAPSVSPASPKTTLILFAVALVSLALQVGAIIFGELLSGRAIVERRPDERGPLYGRVYDARFSESRSRQAIRSYEAEGSGEAAAADRPAALTDGKRKPARPDEGAASGEGTANPPPLRPSRHPRRGPQWVADEPGKGNEAGTDGGAGQERPGSAPTETAASDPGPSERAISSQSFDNLSADMALGRVRLIVLTAVSPEVDAAFVADTLVADAVQMGLSIVRVDAGSGQPSTEPGLTDLAKGEATFGDVIYSGPSEGVALVPWGHAPSIEASPRPRALIEALSDLYEVVVVVAGTGVDKDRLRLFGTDGRLVLVAADEESGPVAQALDEAEAVGFRSIQVVAPPGGRAEVA